MPRHGLDELKGRITVTRGQNPAKIAVPRDILREQHGPVLTGDEFRTDDRLQSVLAGDLQKPDRAIETIGIGEGEKVLSLLFDCLTEGIQRGHAPHRRKGRMCMQVDEGHSITPPIPNGLLTESSMELIERDGELLSPLLPTLLVEGSGIEEGTLLGILS